MSSAQSTAPDQTLVALLRGINVGGKNILPMKELAAIFADAGCVNPRTFIQSGNVIFTATAARRKDLPTLISAQIAARFGHRVPVVLRTTEEMARVVAENPFLQAGQPENTLHVVFLADLPAATAVRSLDPGRCPPDAFHVTQREIYLYLPNGSARTKLNVTYFDSRLSTVGTQRNWATVCKLLDLMRS